jgi:hypothetical protein
VVSLVRAVDGGEGTTDVLVRARVHDRKSPSLPTEWKKVEVRYEVMAAPRMVDMTWYGEYLWRAFVPLEAEAVEVCATDAAGNTGCSPVQEVLAGAPGR